MKAIGRIWRTWRGLIISAAVFALVFGAAIMLIGRVGTGTGEQQLSLVRSAVKRAALTCFAVEGRYPQSVDYLKEHYGLAYDEDRYAVRYDAFASNVMPAIRVLNLKGGAS